MGDISNDSNENTNKNIKENLDSINNFICTKKSNSKRCFCCKKKLILSTCTCGKTFCMMHISPGSHNCARILMRPKDTNVTIPIATGAFSKIDKI
jgi:hypothetical protein|tara:strand:+ start:5762 stop:6046 length:285 start_codon:yes stop_codon:yes gene_type:complete